MGFSKKENTGLDTETYQGYVKLICDHDGRFKEVESFDDIMEFLTHNKFRNKYNWFYNINFDFQSIIKYLPLEDLTTLYINRKIEYRHHTITYLNGKFFSIGDKDKHYYYFYDLFNFLDTSLDKASKKFLKDEKLKIIDANKLNTDWEYWKKNRNDIIRYCIKDAELTKRLADYFWDIIYTHLEFYPKRPFSKGKLSEEYFLSKCYIPTINDILELQPKIIEYAYESYYGGRFELLQKGYLENVYLYDIKSAYPKGISELIDFNNGKWKKVSKLTKDTEYGFYYCDIDVKEAYFSPFHMKLGELNIYPNGKFKKYLPRCEIDFILNNFDNVKIKVIDGFEFYPKELKYPFREEILRLYEWKEKEKDPDIKYAVKIILNSLYGKTIQVSGDENRTGKLFNPVYSALITAGTRNKVLELSLQKPECIIDLNTDGVGSTEKLKVPKNPKLGEFEKDFEGMGVYIMSNIYNLWNDNGESKNRLRGFAFKKEKDYDDNIVSLKDILYSMNKGTTYSYSTSRPYHLGECLLHTKKKTKEMINVFYDSEKEININGDRKRLWNGQFKNGRDALSRCIRSIPLIV